MAVFSRIKKHIHASSGTIRHSKSGNYKTGNIKSHHLSVLLLPGPLPLLFNLVPAVYLTTKQPVQSKTLLKSIAN